MRVYTVHLRHRALDPARDIRLVKEGFSWPAFLFSFLWALWHRLWWEAAALFVLTAGLDVAGRLLSLSQTAGTAISLAVAVAVGMVGNDLLRRALARRGFVETEVVAAKGREAALGRFLDDRPDLASWVAG